MVVQFHPHGPSYNLVMPRKDKALAAEYMREWRRKNATTERLRVRIQVREYRQKLKEIVRQLKDKPCTDCGTRYPHYVMDFDHRPGEQKVCNLTMATRRPLSEAQIRCEVAKCDVVCSNCHRERTHRRRVAKLDCNRPTPGPNASSNLAAPTN